MDYCAWRMNLADPVPAELLPRWLLLVGVIAALNGFQNIVNPLLSQRVYSSKNGMREGVLPSITTDKASPLTARLFALWNITSAMVRIYAAYNIRERGFVLSYMPADTAPT